MTNPVLTFDATDRLSPLQRFRGTDVLCDWIRAQGLDPELIRSFEVHAAGDGRLRVEEYLVNAERRRYRIAETDTVATTVREVPLRTAPPRELLDAYRAPRP